MEDFGGPGRDRTDDLFHAMEARSQLRHRPTGVGTSILSKAVGIVKPQEADTSCRFEVLYFSFGAGVLHLFQCSLVGPDLAIPVKPATIRSAAAFCRIATHF